MPETPPQGEYGPTPAPAVWFSRFGQYSIPAHSTPEHGRPVPNDPSDSGIRAGYLSQTENTSLSSANSQDPVTTPATTSLSTRELLRHEHVSFRRSPAFASSSTIPVYSAPESFCGVAQSSYNTSVHSGYLSHPHVETSYQASYLGLGTQPHASVPLQPALPDDPFVCHLASASVDCSPFLGSQTYSPDNESSDCQ